MSTKAKKLNKLRVKLSEGTHTIGCWQQMAGASITEVLLTQKVFDWIAFDLEHGVFTLSDLYPMILAAERHNVLPFVRISSPCSIEAHRCLELGAAGIIFPNIQSDHQLNELLNKATWPPHGSRGVGYSRACVFGKKFDEHKELARHPFLCAMIESQEGVMEVESIVSNPLLDAILIGPYDLSASLNCLGDFENIKLVESIRKCKQACENNPTSIGIHIIEPDVEKIQQAIEDGYKFLPFSTDALLLLRKLEEVGGNFDI